MHYKIFADSISREIPKQQGVYAFFLDLISPGKIGLAGKGPWSEAILERARASLLRRIRLQSQVFCAVELTGNLAQSDKFGPVQTSFSLNARKAQSIDLAEEISGIASEAIRDYAQLVHDTITFAQPIYVGIAYEQTLFERYLQHRTSHRGDGELGFGSRLRGMGIDWDDVVFACQSFESQSADRNLFRQVERTLHSITHPILSIR